MRLLCLIALFACGDDTLMDSGLAMDGGDDAQTIDVGVDVGNTALSMRFGHFIPDLRQPLSFCVLINGEQLGVFPDNPVPFRALSARSEIEVEAGDRVEVIGTSSACDAPLFSTVVESRGPVTVVGAGLLDTSALLCGDRYNAPCPSSVGVLGREWSDDVPDSGVHLRFVNLSPNSYVTSVCADPDGAGPLPATELFSASSSVSEVVAVDPISSADWFVIRNGFMLDGCDGSPDVLARITIPTPIEATARGDVASTIEEGSVLFLGSGIVRLPPEDADDELDFVPWRD